ncbi:MAG: SEC-C domain-containing protein [Bdellovibrionales bacterium]|nr:SEC-C domain-containing protein [Bdellovibrionales bacterium]
MMMKQITGDAVRKLFAVQIVAEEGAPGPDLSQMMRRRAPQRMQTNLSSDGQLKGGSPAAFLPGMAPAPGAGPANGAVPGRNLPALRSGGGPRLAGPGIGPRPGAGGMSMGGGPVAQPVSSGDPKVGRNDPCWCGSGKKFKKCHGQ